MIKGCGKLIKGELVVMLDDVVYHSDCYGSLPSFTRFTQGWLREGFKATCGGAIAKER